MALAAASASACGEKLTCAGVGLVRVLPRDTTIPLGASFIARYQEGGTCSDERHGTYHDVSVVWRTADTAVVRLDSLTGRVTGRAVGDAALSIADRGFVVSVHVR